MKQDPSLEDLFARALELKDDEREGYLRRIRQNDPESEQALRGYLRALETSPEFLAHPPDISADDILEFDDSKQATAAARSSPANLERIASYSILRTIGVGGMGVVYEAMQDRPRRPVAVKVIRTLGAGTASIRRFEQEAEMLAQLGHPAIAQVYEAGVVDLDGHSTPFFAMELVREARTLLDFAGERDLDRRQRVELFLAVCSGVQHAHGQGVIHRDLKPANILVDRSGQVKIIDFGVARFSERATGSTARTQTGALLGTVAYMSPEQLDLRGDEVDARTDVYSLGVILYELLCGESPYALDGASLPRAVRTVVEEPPLPPSTRPTPVVRDLETVLLKALRKSPDERYATVGELANDLQRYLRDEPISARRPGLTDRMRLWARRRPGIAAGTAAATAVLLLAIVVASGLYQRGEKQRRIAESARAELDQLRATLVPATDVAVGPSPLFQPMAEGLVASVQSSLAASETDEERARVLGVAVDALARLEKSAEGDRELLLSIADTYLDLGNLYGAEWLAGPEKVAGTVRAHRGAVGLLSRLHEVDPEEQRVLRQFVNAETALAQSLRKLDQDEAAIASATRAVELAEKQQAQDSEGEISNRALVYALWARGDALIGQSRPDEGLADSRKAVEIMERLAADRPDDVTTLCTLAWSQFRVGAWLQHHFDGKDNALAAYRAASDARVRACAVAPGQRQAVYDLLVNSGAEVDLLRQLRRDEEAIERQHLLVQTATETLERGGHGIYMSNTLRRETQKLGDMLVAAGRRSEAARLFRSMVQRIERLRQEADDPTAVDEILAKARAAEAGLRAER